jgi:hypothetical protein
VGAGTYHLLDRASGFLLLAMICAAPWLFGTTETWAMNLLNALGYGAGLILALKWVLRWITGALAVDTVMAVHHPGTRPGAWMIRTMVILTAGVIFYCLISALNARATFLSAQQRFEYHPHLSWLPYSYDSTLTWRAFWNYLALACAFWGLRDWMLHPAANRAEAPVGIPERFRSLFWVITVNATVLALESIFQRLLGAERLLWLREPYDNRSDLMFGPFVFRDNAAQYFNLAWPAVLAFWWLLREEARTEVWSGEKIGGRPHLILLPCAILIGAAPIIAGSVSGSIVTATLLLISVAIIFLSHRGTWRARSTIVLVTVSVLALGGALGWDQLAPRLRTLFQTAYTHSNPAETYENARQIALDYPLFGIGPGAFRAIYQLYRADPQQTWHAFLHDDWMEMRVTFGWVGSMLILCLLCLTLTRWFVPGGVPAPSEFIALLWASIGGCLANAKFSFPLQVYSILLLLLVILVLVSCVSQPASLEGNSEPTGEMGGTLA